MLIIKRVNKIIILTLSARGCCTDEDTGTAAIEGLGTLGFTLVDSVSAARRSLLPSLSSGTAEVDLTVEVSAEIITVRFDFSSALRSASTKVTGVSVVEIVKLRFV